MNTHPGKLGHAFEKYKDWHYKCFLAFILNFHNCYKKCFTAKLLWPPFLKKLPQIVICPFLSKFPILITLQISFSFNQAFIFMYKYSCLCFNKSVYNWTFCQLRNSRENPIVRKFLKLFSRFSTLASLLSGDCARSTRSIFPTTCCRRCPTRPCHNCRSCYACPFLETQ